MLKENSSILVEMNFLKLLALFTVATYCREVKGEEHQVLPDCITLLIDSNILPVEVWW